MWWRLKRHVQPGFFEWPGLSHPASPPTARFCWLRGKGSWEHSHVQWLSDACVPQRGHCGEGNRGGWMWCRRDLTGKPPVWNSLYVVEEMHWLAGRKDGRDGSAVWLMPLKVTSWSLVDLAPWWGKGLLPAQSVSFRAALYLIAWSKNQHIKEVEMKGYKYCVAFWRYRLLRHMRFTFKRKKYEMLLV